MKLEKIKSLSEIKSEINSGIEYTKKETAKSLGKFFDRSENQDLVRNMVQQNIFTAVANSQSTLNLNPMIKKICEAFTDVFYAGGGSFDTAKIDADVVDNVAESYIKKLMFQMLKDSGYTVQDPKGVMPSVLLN